MVRDRSFETHPGFNENFGQIEHRLKRGHLFGLSACLPHADIRQCIVLRINSDVISSVALQRANCWNQSLLALISGAYLIE